MSKTQLLLRGSSFNKEGSFLSSKKPVSLISPSPVLVASRCFSQRVGNHLFKPSTPFVPNVSLSTPPANSLNLSPEANHHLSSPLPNATFSPTLLSPNKGPGLSFEGVFSKVPTRELLFSLSILELCTQEWVLKYGPRALELSEKFHMGPLSHFVLQQTFYKHFVAGSSVEECIPVVQKLALRNMNTILDFSVEDALDDEACDRNTMAVVEATRRGSKINGINFSCVKVSAICPNGLLTRMSDLLRYQASTEGFSLPWREPTPAFLVKDQLIVDGTAPVPLNEKDLKSLERLLKRMELLASTCAEFKMPLLVDAEYTHQQPAIDYLAMLMTQKYNHNHPLVYNTYQMYLKDALPRLHLALREAERLNLNLGVKLVRGAYIISEKQTAADKGRPSPCFDSREGTHDSYNEAIDLLLSNHKRVGVMFATHNQTSVETAAQLIRSKGIAPAHPHVHFAQLYGMGEHLSNAIAQQGMNINKYVPYGPVEVVIPYLIRRIQENKDMMGGTAKERELMWEELNRRLMNRGS